MLAPSTTPKPTLICTDWGDIWSTTGAANTAGSITVPDTEDTSANPKRFLRLRVPSP